VQKQKRQTDKLIYIANKKFNSLNASVAKQVSFRRLKETKDSPGCRSLGGRSFHSRGPVAKKLLLPNLLCVRGTNSFCMSLELDRSEQRPVSNRRRQSSARYNY